MTPRSRIRGSTTTPFADHPTTDENVRIWAAYAFNSSHDNFLAYERTLARPWIFTNWGSSGTPGAGRYNSPLRTEKPALPKPMPSASVSTIVIEDKGVRAKYRDACRRSSPTPVIHCAPRASRPDCSIDPK